MKINKISTQSCPSIFFFALLFQTHAAASTTDKQSSFVELGAGYIVSDNIYKSTDNKQTARSATADMALGYKKKFTTTDIALTYDAEYTKENKEELQENNYWTGNALISQQVFSKNLLLNLAHKRRRYLIDPSQANDENNQNENDFLKAGLQWSLPYSDRTTFIVGADHTETWFAGDGAKSDSNSNEALISWQYALSEKSQVQVSYSGSKKKFDDLNEEYRQQKLDTKLTRSYLLGTYSLNIGKTWVDSLSAKNNGEQYGFTINAQMRKHLFTFNASKTLTDSSREFETDQPIAFVENSFFWYTSLSLEHQYIILNDKLVSNLRFDFERSDQLTAIDEIDIKDKYGAFGGLTWSLTEYLRSDLSVSYRRTDLTSSAIKKVTEAGALGKLTWSLTENLSSSLLVSYLRTDLTSSAIKKVTEAEVSAKYNVTHSLYIQLSAAFEKQENIQKTSGYEEQHYTSRIAYKY
ncbi:hypothetical protein Ping_0425 [Psychromonas ingrahamii 37]|uniref:TIGR03016 family PEP-CTERM system-associated outer membrane protein n=1 Tax=Psychromonas ingrahamii (strain DSM 17664 / CCUG 51855 / 37) TaxID=357804 RepID=A1SS20_PSYIN|nr:hypothetical protein [Psychromonas ingrahamii]ABM02285.1 hypothetical protein Ping_0425 [Psychromonas ingrahamii 37]